jgi:hypothetical protein
LTSNGTIQITGAGTISQYVRGDGTLETFPSLTGFVPYTGATADVNLGTHDLTAERGTFANNGSSDTLTVNHTSGSGKGINVSKGGNGEALLVTKTSGSGNAMAVVGGRTALVDLSLSSVSNATGNFLTISGGVVHQRTPSETRSDVGAQAQLNGTGFVKASGTTITYDNSTYQVTSEKGQPNGYASLDSNGKVPLVQINDALIGNVNFQGLWNAATNTPTLANPPASGTKGYYYIVSTAGTFASISFEVGDWIISDGTAWGKVDNTDAVSSVFGRTGNVTAANGDYTTAQVTESGNLYYTDGRARGAISLTTTGASGSSTYNNTTGVLNVPAYTLSGLGGIGGTLATGQVAFGTAANTIGGSNNLFWDNVNGFLGIGTTSIIDEKLTVLGNIHVDGVGSGIGTFGPFVEIGKSNGPKIQATQEGSDNDIQGLAFFTKNSTITADNPTERWRISSVGILQSNGAQTIRTSTGNLTLTSADNTGIVDIRRNDRALGAELRITNSFNGSGWLAGDIIGTLNFFTSDATGIGPHSVANITAVSGGVNSASPDGNLIFSTGGYNVAASERWRINNTGILQSNGAQTIQTSTGNLTLATNGGNGNIVLSPNGTGDVGIGVTNMSSFFNQASNLVIGNTGNVGLTIYSSTGGNNVIAFADVADAANSGFNAGGCILYAHSDNSMRFRVNGAERFSIVNTGNLLINTTTDAGFRLDVNGTGRFSGQVNINNANAFIRHDTGSIYRGLSIGASVSDNNEYAFIKYEPNQGDLRIWGSPASFGGKTTFFNNNVQWLNVSGTNALTFTGAATFSSSVTASGAIKLLTAPNGTNAINFGTSAVNYHTINYDDSTGKLTFNTDSSRIVSFLNSNVGIGTDSPSGILHLSKGAADLYVESTGGAGNTSRLILKNTAREWRTGADTDGNFWHYDATALQYRFWITSGGNVGIGTASPDYLLTVGQPGVTQDSVIQIASTTNGTGSLYFGDTAGTFFTSRMGGFQYSHFNNLMVFITNATEQMIITSGGNVEISTGSIKTGNPSGDTARPFKIGSVNNESDKSFAGNILKVEVNGTIYRLMIAE